MTASAVVTKPEARVDRRRFPICGHTFDEQTCRRRGEHLCLTRVGHVLAFFCELLVHTKGDFARKPFIPAPWQLQRILTPLFGQVKWDPNRGRYVRRYRELYLNIGRKNGKTELLAAIVLYLLCADGEESAEIYGLALDKDQASLVFRVAARMVELSPTLAHRLQVLKAARRILDEQTASFYAVSAGDAMGALGPNPHCAYIDELLTQPDRELYDALRTGLGTRAQPLVLLATTAENDPAGFAASERAWSERVIADPDLDPGRLVVMYTTDPDADWTDESTWAQANPGLDDFLDRSVLQDECRKAIANPAAERAFRQYRLNQPVGAIGRAINMIAWDDTPGPLGWPELEVALVGRRCTAGLDLASTADLAAYALVFPDGYGGMDIIWRHFTPAAAVKELDRRTGGQASVWARDGLLTVTDGNVIDYKAITAALEVDRGRYEITEVAFDRWGATQLSTELLDDGWPLVTFGQGFASMSGPTKEFLRLIGGGLWRHGGNPLARWQAANLVTRTDPAGNLKPDKARSGEKIDGIVAAVMGLDRALHAPVVEPDYAAAGFS